MNLRSSRLSLFDTVSLSNFLPLAITTKMLRLQEIFGTVRIDCDQLHFITEELILFDHPRRMLLAKEARPKEAIPPHKEGYQRLFPGKPTIPYQDILYYDPYHTQILHIA